jgi:diguanylate cyclase (GGDEF)-like protein
MYVDLDGFKNVNDTLGHAAGDAVLKALVERLFESRRDGDFVGRLGGDEFVVILTNTRPDTPVAALAADVLRRLCAPVALANGETVTLGASIGLAQFPRHGITREALLHAADEAMYAVKRHGKNAIASAIGGPAAS